MVIINPIICKECHEEQQAEDILLHTNSNGDLVKTCAHCGDEVKV